MTRVKPAASRLPYVAVTYHVADKEWELLQEYRVWESVTDSAITIPKGFRFDLASVPRLFWRLAAPFELSIVAPLCHDYLYKLGGVLPRCHVQPLYREFSRGEADRIFLELMRSEQVPPWRARAAYMAVRAFGGLRAWRG